MEGPDSRKDRVHLDDKNVKDVDRRFSVSGEASRINMERFREIKLA
jgi:hypothetical protein